MAIYTQEAPSRESLDGSAETILLEFGADWCGYCRRAQPIVDAALARRSGIRHLRVEDGPGRALGRSFRVKLWPTLILLGQGRELARVVRPSDAAELESMFAALESRG